MRLRRRELADPGDAQPIQRFWQWWADAGRSAAEAGIGGAGFDRFTGEMTARVKAIHPNLAWELAPGTRAKHALVVTAAGVPERRRDAERWYQSAPPVSAIWEYHPARQASPAALRNVLEFGGQQLNLADLMFDLHVNTDRAVIDTVVFHPAFANMTPEERGQVGFLALDWALGEDGVSRWIGRYSASADRPATGLQADGLIETVQGLAHRSGKPRWALMRGERDGAVALALVAITAKWIDHPLLDQHVAVKLPFADQTPAGLPGPVGLDQLRAIEHDLTERLEPRALLIAHETIRGTRTLHWYADSDDRGAAEDIRAALAGWPGATATSAHDPGWRAIRHLLSP
jgi:hypothetical protein